MDLDPLLARFEAEHMEINSISAGRRIDQLRVLRRFAATLDHPLDELTAQDLALFTGAEVKRGLHPNTAHKHMSMIRAFVDWASAAGLIDPVRTHQLKSVSKPRGATPGKPKPYKIAEIKEFRRILSAKYPALPQTGAGSRGLRDFLHGRAPRLRRHLWRHARRLQFEAQIALALEQGLRRIEIHSLTIPALHYDNDQIVVRTAKQGPRSDRVRAIPYTSHARNCVQEWLDFRALLKPPHDSPWLQLDYLHDLDTQLAPLTLNTMGTALHVFGPGWRWHRFRHTACTEWLRSGVPLEKARLFMGHSNLETTLLYAEIVASDIDHAFGAAEADFAHRLGLAA